MKTLLMFEGRKEPEAKCVPSQPAPRAATAIRRAAVLSYQQIVELQAKAGGLSRISREHALECPEPRLDPEPREPRAYPRYPPRIPGAAKSTILFQTDAAANDLL